MRSYIVYRHGSNSANQPMLDKAILGTVEACSPRDADRAALGKYGSRCYANQHLTVRAESRCSQDDRDAAWEADAKASEIAEWITSQRE